MAHTPGPWIFEKLRAGTILAIQSGKIRIAEVVTWATVDPIAKSEQDANAHLIAAAPELLEALEAAVGFIDSHCADPDITAEMREAYSRYQASNAPAVIAKAKGLNPDQG